MSWQLDAEAAWTSGNSMDADILPIPSMHGSRSEALAGDSCFSLSDRSFICRFQWASLPDEDVEWKRFRPSGSRRGPQAISAERVLIGADDAFASSKDRVDGSFMRNIRSKIPGIRFQRIDSANIRIDGIPKSLFEWGGEGAYV